ncbi:MAG TPA: aspartyl/asparaginyl beta-hydroxylase domain-containing protein, partial [Kofleriaceae bacterium]
MQPVIKFDRTYDVGRMRTDLEVALRWGVEHMNRGDYHDGGWRAVPLHAVEGRTDAQALRWAGWDATYHKTPILDACPYLESIVEEFHCPKERVRLLRLEPGKNINTHTDLGDGWAMGKVRLHIPIIT